MTNSNIKMTLENEFLKSFILNNYDSNTLTIAYGSFYTANGYFALVKKTKPNGIFKYSFFLHDVNGNKSVDMENYNDETKLKECLKLVGLVVDKKEPALKKCSYTQLSIFDFI